MMGLDWRLKDPRPNAADASALGSHQMWTGRRGRFGRVLQLTLSVEIPVLTSAGDADGSQRPKLTSALFAAGSYFLGRQAVVFLPIVLLHLLAFYALASDQIRLSRVLTPILVRFVPLEQPTRPPDPPTLAPGALQIDNTLAHILPPQLEMDVMDGFASPAPSRIEAPPPLEPPKEEEIPDGEEGNFVRPRAVRGPSGIDRYPSGSIAAKESGRATITICIAATGKVETVELAKSTGFERLDNAALDIARQYQFKPAMRKGKPIPVCLPYSINYKLK
jgi:periplasmic protein TonB